MPILKQSSYSGPPIYLFNRHLQTIIPSRYRVVEGISYVRERIDLKDGDFLDLDWIHGDPNKVVILTHGLEGNSTRQYILGAARAFSEEGWTVLAWNCRSCSEEINLLPVLYHHGEIGDIAEVIAHVNTTIDPQHIALVGFSMGGSITMKYLGVHGSDIPKNIRCAVSFSPPSRLTVSVESVEHWSNRVYHKTFLERLKRKIRRKEAQFPGIVDIEKLDVVRTWYEFDTWFTCPINGFESAEDFYYQASSAYFVDGIQRPTLLVNAENDPICPPDCNPTAVAAQHPYLFLETPRQGGHVGFTQNKLTESWMEVRALSFVNEHIP